MRKSVGVRVAMLCCCLHVAVASAKVVNLGYPGANTAELDSKFGAALSLHPDWIVLFAGANDALNPAKFLAVEQSREHVTHMIDEAQAAGVRVMLVSVQYPDTVRLMKRHPASDYGDAPPDRRVSALNDMLRQVARERHVELADFNAVLQAHGGANAQLSTDGLHLTGAGYELLASTVRTQLPRRNAAKLKIVCFGDSLTYGIGVRAAGDAPETTDTYPAQLDTLLRR